MEILIFNLKRKITKSFRAILIASFFFHLNHVNAGYGSGELNISGKALNWFIQYIQNPGGVKNPNKSPMKFSVSLDGRNGWYYYCQAMNASRCQSVSDKELNKQCERKNKVSKCEVFAVGRSIKWRNGIAENNKIKLRKSDSREELIAKLKQLGFIKNESTKIKSIKTSKSKEKDLSTQLVEITELYKSGSITKDEYTKAKNKLLGK